METTDYCSYELSNALKAAGFDEECREYYTPEGDLDSTTYADNFNRMGAQYKGEWFSNTISAPTLWQAQKWLREKKQINVLIGDCACGYYWEVSKAGDEQTRGTMLIYYDDNGEDENSGMWLSYEAALSAGISAALELIKKGE